LRQIPPKPVTDLHALKADITRWAMQLGFQQLGVSDIDLATAEARLQRWLDAGWHGEMRYMQRHGSKRSRPAELLPGTLRVISVRMDYLPEDQRLAAERLDHDSRAYISRYALGRDYHKVLRKRLAQLATIIESHIGTFGYRAFVDSAPVLEKALAQKAGIGWIGKHTNLIRCPWMPPRSRTAVPAAPVSTSVRPPQSLRPTSSTRGAVFPT
jgi:epoxyqueuosine reductase